MCRNQRHIGGDARIAADLYHHRFR